MSGKRSAVHPVLRANRVSSHWVRRRRLAVPPRTRLAGGVIHTTVAPVAPVRPSTLSQGASHPFPDPPVAGSLWTTDSPEDSTGSSIRELRGQNPRQEETS